MREGLGAADGAEPFQRPEWGLEVSLCAVPQRPTEELGTGGRPPLPACAADTADAGVEALGGNAPGEHADDADDHQEGEGDVEDEDDGHFWGLRVPCEVL